METERTYELLQCAYKVHTFLGPGLLESTYEPCFVYELIKKNFSVERQKALPIIYNDVKLDAGYRIDLLIDEEVIVEVKSVDKLHELHFAQVLTYLKLSGLELGYLINFNSRSLKDGIKRVILTP